MPLFTYPFLMQLPLAEAGQLFIVMGISFAIITLISSTARFHKMIQMGEDELISSEDRNNFFFIQVTRYLSKINRTSSGFVIFIAQLRTEQSDPSIAQNQLLQALKKIAREEDDKVCLFRDDCVAAIIDTEENRAADVTERMIHELKQLTKNLPNISAIRAGVSSFPLHGLKSQQVIDVAADALEQANFDSEHPIHIAPEPEDETGTETKENRASEKIGELSRKDKNSALDPLTGVIKPALIGSYFRKYLMEIRRKKNSASMLCIGVNRIDNILDLQGEAAADAVLVGVSEILQKLTRDSDLIGRYHRDDFVILAPCSLEQGEMIAQRIRKAVQAEIFLFEGTPIKTTVAIGITAHPEHGRTLRDLFEGAHTALQVLRGWNTSSCLVYDPAQHSKKDNE
jgi:diguanylate cyclase (GGDEF)-like protein